MFKRSHHSLLFSLLVLSLFAPAGSAQVIDTYVIPAIGNTQGAGSTRWATELSIFNPQTYPLKVTLVFLPTGVAQGLEVAFTVDSNETVTSNNILLEAFNRSGTGSLLVATFPEDNPGVPNDTISRSFLVRTKTYNNASSGTFGQAIPGVWTGLLDFESDQISAVAHGVTNKGIIGSSGYRTNIGAVNLGRTGIRMYVNVYSSNGAVIAQNLPFDVPPQGHIQDLLPVEVDRGSLEFFVDDPTLDAVVFPYASVIDNRSGDPVYVNPILLASPGVIYSKLAAGTMELGKKIDTTLARQIALSAKSLGEWQRE